MGSWSAGIRSWIRTWHRINRRRDISYPYRLDRYRASQFGSAAGKSPLIVVHGYGANLYGMQWLMHVLADLLSDDYVVYQFAFETQAYLSQNPLSLELASRELGHELRRVVERDELSLEHAAFIGHSTGGLVVRRAFIDNKFLWKNARFVFFGSPHYGAEVADLKNGLTRRDKQTHELAPASDFIWRLNRDWAELPEGAAERVLSIVGTKARRRFQWGLPKGRWVQADGVVRATSALLTTGTPTQHYVMFVPRDHSELKNISIRWRKQGSLRRGWQQQPLIVEEDLPMVATFAFFLPKGEWKSTDQAEYWKRCLRSLELLETEYHTVKLRELEGCVQQPDGTWSPGDDYEQCGDGRWVRKALTIEQQIAKDLYGEEILLRWVDEKKRQEHENPSEPRFLNELKTYCEELQRYWIGDAFGSVIVRLDFIDMPPEPMVVGVFDASTQSSHPVSVPRKSFIRRGERWATFYLPELQAGKYRIAWKYDGRQFDAYFSVTAHFMTMLEMNGSTVQWQSGYEQTMCRVLSGDCERLASEFDQGIDYLQEQLAHREWDVGAEISPFVDVNGLTCDHPGPQSGRRVRQARAGLRTT